MRSTAWRSMPGTAIGDFEKRPAGARHAATAQLDHAPAHRRGRVLDARSRTGSTAPGAGAWDRRGSRCRRRPGRSRSRPAASSVVWQNSARNSCSQSASVSRSGRVTSRRDSCMTLPMIVLTRSALVRMISVRRRSSSPRARRFRKQLTGVAHGSHRVAYLVRDARAQAAERRELGLAHGFVLQARVLQEYQHRARVRAAQGREVRLDHATAVGGNE